MKQGKSQRERFEETARELECDEGQAKFNESLKRLAKPKPEQKEQYGGGQYPVPNAIPSRSGFDQIRGDNGPHKFCFLWLFVDLFSQPSCLRET